MRCCDLDAILAKTRLVFTTLDTECWEWQGRCDTKRGGYPLMDCSDCDDRDQPLTVQVHRHLFEMLEGPLLAGFELDHVCRWRSCIRPCHLEAVTHAENVARQDLAHWATVVPALGLAVLLDQPVQDGLFELADVPRFDAISRYASH